MDCKIFDSIIIFFTYYHINWIFIKIKYIYKGLHESNEYNLKGEIENLKMN